MLTANDYREAHETAKGYEGDAEAAAEALAAVVKEYRDYAEAWKPGGRFNVDGTDSMGPEMVETARQDAARLVDVCNNIRTGNRAAAALTASNLDTIVREDIPAAVWVYLGGELLKPSGV